MPGWLSPAGGAVYHLRALRYRRVLWHPFEVSLSAWLEGWEPGSDSVLLVGPSAGYCLTDRFLARFRDVLALEPDPLARWLFRRRLARLGIPRVVLSTEDVIAGGLLESGRRFEDLLAEEPARAVVFCNVLGQIRFLIPDDAFGAWTAAFVERVVPALGGRGWASFHDRLSGDLTPELDGSAASSVGLEDQALLARFYANPPASRTTVELVDHLTGGLWPSSFPRRYFSWEIAPGRFHLIEGIRATSPD